MINYLNLRTEAAASEILGGTSWTEAAYREAYERLRWEAPEQYR